MRRNQCAECVDVWISRTTGCCIVVRRAGVFDGVKIHKDLSDGVQGLFDVLRRCTRIYTIVREDGFAAAKLAQYRETLERTDYSDVWERSKKLKLPFFCQLPKDIGNLSSGELAEYTKKVLDADEQGGV